MEGCFCNKCGTRLEYEDWYEEYQAYKCNNCGEINTDKQTIKENKGWFIEVPTRRTYNR